MRRHRLIPLVLTLAMLAGCRSDPAPPPIMTTLATPGEVVIPMAPKHGLYFVRASVNGADAGYFLVDSGSTLTVIDDDLAKSLALPVTGQVTVEGIGGRPTVRTVSLESVTIGGVALGPQVATEIDLGDTFRNAGIRIGGILGYNTLQQRPFTIDYLAQTIRFHDPATFTPPADLKGYQLRTVQGLPAVRATIEGEPCWLQIDTGADRSLMLPSYAAEDWPALLRGKRNISTNSRGVGGQIVNIRSTVRSMRLLGLELLEVPLEVEWTERRPSHRGEVVGRLGSALLSNFRLTFDPRNDTIYPLWRPR